MRTTTTKPPRKQVERRVHLYDGNPKLLEMTIGAETFVYWLKIIDADYGIGVEVRMPLPETEVYHVHYDLQRQLSTCDCLGGTHHGHCKHQEAVVALLRAGKLAVPAPQQPASAPASGPIAEPAQTVDSTSEPAKARYCRHCGCLESEHVAGFCPA